jgi:HEAT repeat protein
MKCALAAIILVAALAGVVAAQTTQPALPDGRLDFGVEGLTFPPVVIVNGHTPRTAELLGEAYRRREPLVWKRTQYVADLGHVMLAAGAPFVIEAMADPAPQVRAEAARAAAQIGEASLLVHVERLVGDSDGAVRREAVLAAGALARRHQQSTTAIERGLADPQAAVTAAALQSAWTAAHAAAVAHKLPSLPPELQAEGAVALGRMKAADHAQALLPMLGGDVVQRLAAVRAFGEIAKAQQHDAIAKMLADPHPTVRRAAITATGQLDPEITRGSVAIKVLDDDADPTVREAAVRVLTPVATSPALVAIARQLDSDYAPLHAAARDALVRPADDAKRAQAIALAAEMLAHANPRRREDASYILGRLRSGAAFERHVALLKWDRAGAAQLDWPVVAQAAESLGRIGDPRSTAQLMTLVTAAPDALEGMQRPQGNHMSRAMSNALVAAARLGHRPAVAEAVRILQLNPDTCPADLRAAAAFAIGALGEAGGAPPEGVNFFAMYASPFEGRDTKLEALKALGNLRHAASSARLKEISDTDATPDLRWIAHWSYQRAARQQVPYTPPTAPREPPVTITDLPKNQP